MPTMESPMWLGKPILHKDHETELEQRAAINEFHHRMPRAEAETRAHEEYKNEQHSKAAAYHYKGMRAALGAGDQEQGHKHGVMYDLHMKAMGQDAHAPVPESVKRHLTPEAQEKVYKFKAHPSDMFVLNDTTPKFTPRPDRPG